MLSTRAYSAIETTLEYLKIMRTTLHHAQLFPMMNRTENLLRPDQVSKKMMTKGAC